MKVGETGVSLPFPGGLFGHGVGQDPQGAAGLQGADIGLGGAFEIGQAVEGIGDGLADDQDAVVAHDQGGEFWVTQHFGAAATLVGKGHAAVVVVHHLTVEKHGRVLVDRRQAAVGKRGQHGGVHRMDMHDAAGMRQGAVDRTMQAPGGGVGRVGAVHGARVIGVNLDQRRGGDAGKVAAIGVDQEPCPLGVDGQRKVVGHRFVQVQFDGPAESGGHVGPLGPMGQVGMAVHVASP